jgi:hypothetical protein
MPTGRETPADDVEAVALAARATVERVGPQLRVESRWGVPWYVGNDPVCAVRAFRSHVGVEFFRGSSLASAHPILEGTGKNLRHAKLRTVEEARSKSFEALVRAAARLDRVEPRRGRSIGPFRAR